MPIQLTEEQVNKFLSEGILVVDDVLTKSETLQALEGMQNTLHRHGVESLDEEDIDSAKRFSNLSSTNGSGGVLDIFYEPWKFEVATHPNLFAITQQLWEAAYCHKGETREEMNPDEAFRWHPNGAFDCQTGFLYMDRVGYRLPSSLSQKWGNRIHPNKKPKARSVQRSLTPHLDCCPHQLHQDSKWRPIQCFVSLTDNREPNTGGFEAAPGFHRDFDKWVSTRPPTLLSNKEKDGTTTTKSIPAPCIGQYTHIRPKEDRDVMERVQHIPLKAGSAVLWDNRIPHANAYHHRGDQPRAVIYCSFLPDVPINREYLRNQLEDFRAKRPPRDQWNHMEKDRMEVWDASMQDYELSDLGRRLMGIDPWDA
eukprot:Nitzschia sp. Nitz4//scaffold41_size133979//109106//110206//NITZ4_003367-RA/size133979-processed-gene-0.265-mRNA-1//-1//CDS//3329551530//7009//frame0